MLNTRIASIHTTWFQKSDLYSSGFIYFKMEYFGYVGGLSIISEVFFFFFSIQHCIVENGIEIKWAISGNVKISKAIWNHVFHRGEITYRYAFVLMMQGNTLLEKKVFSHWRKLRIRTLTLAGRGASGL